MKRYYLWFLLIMLPASTKLRENGGSTGVLAQPNLTENEYVLVVLPASAKLPMPVLKRKSSEQKRSVGTGQWDQV